MSVCLRVLGRTIRPTLALMIAIVASISPSPAMATVSEGFTAPAYTTSLAKLNVYDHARQRVSKSLSDISAGRVTVIYFWSARDNKLGDELSVLSHYRSEHINDRKIVAVALAVGGDERNSLSRKMAAKYPNLAFVFDDKRQLYGNYCLKNKSECRSAFVIEKSGNVLKARAGDGRDIDLASWLADVDAAITPASTSVRQPVLPPDVQADYPYADEVVVALQLGYMKLPDGRNFKPDNPIKAGEFVACIQRGLKAVGYSTSATKPDKPNELITKQQAAKLLVDTLLSPEEIDSVCKKCGNCAEYLVDFRDANMVSGWAEKFLTAGIYKAWMPDIYWLRPDKPVSRGYAAALLARAFPRKDAYTGLVLSFQSGKCERVQSMQIVSEAPSGACDVLYLLPSQMPSMSYIQAPGVLSYCQTEQEAKERRVGDNPLIVSAVAVRKNSQGRWQIVLTPEDAAKVRDEDKKSLFFRTWRVALVTETQIPRNLANRKAPEPSSEEYPAITQ